MEPLQRYILHQRLGAGGMGVVHLGTLMTPAGERRVAIKQLSSRGSLDELGRARLIAEARLVFRLTHTNICQVLDLGENERGTFVVMELVSGLDLRALGVTLRAEGRRLDVASAVHIAREVARGLDYAHRRTDERGAPLGLVHGDVTPQNVLLSVEGEVKLADFGIARALGTRAPGAGILAGTRGFVAPERATGGGDHRADIYSLGVTLVVALGGDAGDDPAVLAARRGDMSPELVSIIRRATARNATGRFVSAAELERELSLELARRFPAFTPSQLAHEVRQCRLRGALLDEPMGGATETVTSLVEDFGDTVPEGEEALPPALPLVQPHTQTAMADEPRSRWARLLALGSAVVAVGGLWWALGPRPSLRSAASAPAVTSRPALAPVATDTAEPPAAAPAPVVPATAAALATAAPPRATPPVRSSPARAAAHARAARADAVAGFLTISSTPWGAVFIDGRRVADETPVYRHRVAPGDHTVIIRYADGAASTAKRVHVAAGELRTLGFAK